jgi:uncharacterized phage protein (TIGR01671 family)
MRDITFRARRTDNGEWVEGNLVWIKNCNDEPYQCFIISHLAYMEYGEFDDTYQVLPETVGQFVGLTDKNGKKVFEGDIIKADNWLHSYMKIYTIVFEDGGFCAKYKDEDGWNFDHLANIEVIGNVFDNAELLEVT